MLSNPDLARAAYAGSVIAANIVVLERHYDHVEQAARAAYAHAIETNLGALALPATLDELEDAHDRAYNTARDAAYTARAAIPAYESLAA